MARTTAIIVLALVAKLVTTTVVRWPFPATQQARQGFCCSLSFLNSDRSIFHTFVHGHTHTYSACLYLLGLM